MKKNYLSVLSFALIGFINAQDSASILFIGNSYTYVNDLPTLLFNLADSQGDYIEHSSSTPGGATFQTHVNSPATFTAINNREWDFVALQAQSQEPSFSDTQVNSQTLPFAEQLADSVYANYECSDVLMFMTWGRENGDPQWAPISTFEGMNNRLRAGYMRMADSVQGSVCPVGVAWKYVRDNNPTIQLYSGDGSHPSIYGSYLAACTFYASVFRKTPVGAPFISTISQADATILQTAAALSVLDSLDQWNLHPQSEHTLADFTYVINGAEVTFTNTSIKGSSFYWDFEDGQTSTDESPTITYSGNGTYTVTLIAESACDTDEIQFQITIEEASIIETIDLGLTYAQISDGVFEVLGTNEIDLITVLDASGRIVSESSNSIVDLSNEPKGLYLINIQFENKIQRIRVLR